MNTKEDYDLKRYLELTIEVQRVFETITIAEEELHRLRTEIRELEAQMWGSRSEAKWKLNFHSSPITVCPFVDLLPKSSG